MPTIELPDGHTSLYNFHTDRVIREALSPRLSWASPSARYQSLWDYYHNNSLYTGHYLPEAMRGIRSSVNRSVEFYVAKIMPTQHMEIDAEPVVKDAIDQIGDWSNFQAKKPLWLRDFSLLGNLFVKLETSADGRKVYARNIDPALIGENFTVDTRGYLQTIRIDVPLDDGQFYTEYWDKETWQVWRHNRGAAVELDQLGTPTEEGTTAQLGIDFVPFVHARFRDVGDLLGAGCVDHAIDKIDEANRKATRLSQMQFRYNKPLWVVWSGMEAGGAAAAPALGSADLEAIADDPKKDLLSLAGAGSVSSLVPDVRYADALALLNADLDELEKDLPELKMYSLTANANLATETVAKILGAALDRAAEARLNFVQAMTRVNQIGMTMGGFTGALPETRGLDFEKGEMDLEFILGDILETTISEKAATYQMLKSAGMEDSEALRQAGLEKTVGGVVTRQVALTVQVQPVETPAAAPTPTTQPAQ